MKRISNSENQIAKQLNTTDNIYEADIQEIPDDVPKRNFSFDGNGNIVIILDEPTAALDPKSEYEIYQRFYQMVSGKMAFFISHRMATTKFCDRIAVFSQGQLLEIGTHEELMGLPNGIYRTFYHMQADSYK